MMRSESVTVAVACWVLSSGVARADTTTFFQPCQVAVLESSGVTDDTISSNGHLFTHTLDKLFTGGTGGPIGRPIRVPWPSGIEAQAVTTPPPGVTDHHARVTIRRVDGQPFDFPAISFQLLANTAGAGASLEIMPLLNGEDGLPDPVAFDATGYYGMTFSYDSSPNPWGSTALLTGFDTYQLSLYVDFALIGLSFTSSAPGPQACCLAGGSCADLSVDTCVAQGGLALGGGTSCACDACAVEPPLVFADGFELGDTSGWSTAAP